MADVSRIFSAFVDSLTVDQKNRMLAMLDNMVEVLAGDQTELEEKYRNVSGQVSAATSEQAELTTKMSDMRSFSDLMSGNPYLGFSADMQAMKILIDTAQSDYQRRIDTELRTVYWEQQQALLAAMLLDVREKLRQARLFRSVVQFRIDFC